MDIKKILSALSQEEKVALVSGTDFMYTNPIPSKNIKSLHMSDGPHGLRVQTEGGDNGVSSSLPSTSFPTASLVASSWNVENSYLMGEAMAKEAHKYNINIVLGPSVNIKRNPLGGRNFEYYSEDPYLASQMAIAEVKGLQDNHVGASIKHFALNNSENYRFMGDSIADERAIREIYLKVFEKIVKEAEPATIMCAYNKINGEYCSQNRWLLSDVLRDEWGFNGFVMTDWGAMHDRVKSLEAGLDLEMPGDSSICRKWLIDGLKNKTLKEEILDKACLNILNIIDKYKVTYQDDCSFEDNDELAYKIALDSAVLLKNENNILPLNLSKKYLIIGELFEKMRYQGSGSSMINPTKITTPMMSFKEDKINFEYYKGYKENSFDVNQDLINEAVEAAKNYETILVFIGLTDYFESEGQDRENMSLPKNQVALIEELTKLKKKIVLVYYGGSPVETDYINDIQAFVSMYLPGQCGGRATRDLLFGKANFSGKLAETWAKKYSDVPFYNEFSKTTQEIYKESILVGYRYYLFHQDTVRFPFGFGLSYTTFEYSNLRVNDQQNEVEITVDIKNTGSRGGKEVVELYVSSPKTIYRPIRELKAFKKIYLNPNETKRVTLFVSKDDLNYFDIKEKQFRLEQGVYSFEICSDCEHVLLEKEIEIKGEKITSPYSYKLNEIYSKGDLELIDNNLFEEILTYKIPPLPSRLPITLESRFSDLKQTFLGRILFKAVLSVASKQKKEALKMKEGSERDNKLKGAMFLKRILESNSIITMSMSSSDNMNYNLAQGFVYLANGHILKGIKSCLSKIKVPELPKNKEK